MENITRTNLSSAKIRKITVGELHAQNFTVSVGKSMNINRDDKVFVTQIIRDENAFFLFGAVVYLVYVKRNGKGEEVLWRYFEHHKVMVELDV